MAKGAWAVFYTCLFTFSFYSSIKRPWVKKGTFLIPVAGAASIESSHKDYQPKTKRQLSSEKPDGQEKLSAVLNKVKDTTIEGLIKKLIADPDDRWTTADKILEHWRKQKENPMPEIAKWMKSHSPFSDWERSIADALLVLQSRLEMAVEGKLGDSDEDLNWVAHLSTDENKKKAAQREMLYRLQKEDNPNLNRVVGDFKTISREMALVSANKISKGYEAMEAGSQDEGTQAVAYELASVISTLHWDERKQDPQKGIFGLLARLRNRKDSTPYTRDLIRALEMAKMLFKNGKPTLSTAFDKAFAAAYKIMLEKSHRFHRKLNVIFTATSKTQRDKLRQEFIEEFAKTPRQQAALAAFAATTTPDNRAKVALALAEEDKQGNLWTWVQPNDVRFKKENTAPRRILVGNIKSAKHSDELFRTAAEVLTSLNKTDMNLAKELKYANDAADHASRGGLTSFRFLPPGLHKADDKTHSYVAVKSGAGTTLHKTQVSPKVDPKSGMVTVGPATKGTLAQSPLNYSQIPNYPLAKTLWNLARAPRQKPPAEMGSTRQRPQSTYGSYRGGSRGRTGRVGSRAGGPRNPNYYSGNPNQAVTPEALALSGTPHFKSAVGKCIQCHTQGGREYPEVAQLAPSLKNANIVSHIAQMNDFALEKMKALAKLTKEEADALNEFVKKARETQYISHRPSSPGSIDACFMSEADRARLIGGFPQIKGDSALAHRLTEALDTSNIIFYDQTSVPKTWQGSKNSDYPGRAPKLLTARNRTNPHMYSQMGYNSDGTYEFPWQFTAGTDISPNASASKFLIPYGETLASFYAMTRRNSPQSFGTSVNINGPQLMWKYGENTVAGEVLKVTDPETQEAIPFEIRLRIKTAAGWTGFDVQRPFANSREMAEAIRKLCARENPPGGCAQIFSSGTIEQLENPRTRLADRREFVNARNFRTRRDPLTLSSTAGEALQPQVTLHELPDLPPDIVRILLKETPFKSVFNQPWVEGPPPSWAPTTRSAFNIVPQNYFAAFIPMTENGCRKCHDSAGRHVEQFDPDPRTQMFAHAPNDAARPRTWYNFIPGSDGILSFHPFDARQVARGGPATLSSINDCLIDSGLFVDPSGRRKPRGQQQRQPAYLNNQNNYF